MLDHERSASPASWNDVRRLHDYSEYWFLDYEALVRLRTFLQCDASSAPEFSMQLCHPVIKAKMMTGEHRNFSWARIEIQKWARIVELDRRVAGWWKARWFQLQLRRLDSGNLAHRGRGAHHVLKERIFLLYPRWLVRCHRDDSIDVWLPAN